MTDETLLFELRASPFRRGMALIALLVLAGGLLTLAFGEVSDIWRLVFVGLAAAVLWSGNRLRIATAGALCLTRAGLETSDGRMLAEIGNIQSVERGTLAFKPSNGFLVRLKTADWNGWAPGLWWKVGRRIGVGGTLSARQSRAMAEGLAALVMERDGEE